MGHNHEDHDHEHDDKDGEPTIVVDVEPAEQGNHGQIWSFQFLRRPYIANLFRAIDLITLMPS